MALPSERLALVSRRAAFGAMLRLAVVWSAFGIVRLVAVGLRALVVGTVEPGDGGSALAGLVGLYGGEVGGTWAALFLVLELLAFGAQAAMLGWAVRRADREDPLALLIVLGAAGVVARVGLFGATFLVTTTLAARRSIEDLAAHGIASALSGALGEVLSWALWLGVLGALVHGFVRARATELDEGSYREPAA